MDKQLPSPPIQELAQQLYIKNVELLEQRRRFEHLLYEVSEAVFAVDANFKITIFNNTAEEILNLKKEDAIGKQADEVFKLQTEAGAVIKASDFCFQGDPQKENLEGVVLLAPTKNRYVNVRASVVVASESVKECLVTVSDITKEKQLEKTKDEFISITSHELRTPITIIKSYLWMLNTEKGGILSDKQKGYLEKAVKGAERLLSLINDILNVSRAESGKILFRLEKVVLPEFLSELDDEFKIKTDEKGLWLKVEVQPKVFEVYADKNKLREVFLNFLGNAVKFTQTGGITIKIENIGEEKVKVSIVDTGRGISSENLAKLFSKFGRLDSNYTNIAESGGTGLGLYISKIFVEKMGGQVGVASEGVGKGSTFWFVLQAANPNSKVCTIVSK
ncbi:MAG: hypothetical protein ACD_22C00062G0006 [uncultured bacterium]|nr:MAG: hypothetical protein ACD_22C00062G0006 [uncultured bacterium]